MGGSFSPLQAADPRLGDPRDRVRETVFRDTVFRDPVSPIGWDTVCPEPVPVPVPANRFQGVGHGLGTAPPVCPDVSPPLYFSDSGHRLFWWRRKGVGGTPPELIGATSVPDELEMGHLSADAPAFDRLPALRTAFWLTPLSGWRHEVAGRSSHRAG